MKKGNSTVQFIARTAIGIALVILAQLIGKMLPAGAVIAGPFSVTQLVTGSLVNCVLFVFTAQVGILSGVIIGFLSSILASLIGIGPAVVAVVPVVGCGNAILALVFGLVSGKRRELRAPAVLFAAAVKCGFLWVCVPAVLKALGTVAEKQVAALSIMFSWPQGVTALIGGVLALIIIPRLAKVKKES